MKSTLFICGLFAALAVMVGCRSRGIDVTLQNDASVPIRNVEVDYPGAAFGTGSIAPGTSFIYRIKPAGEGELTVSFDLEKGKVFKQKGPAVHAGESGRITLVVDQDAQKQWRLRADNR